MKLDGLPSTVMPSPAVTLTFDFLTPKSKQHTHKLKNRAYICDKNWVKFPLNVLIFEIWRSQRFSGHINSHTG